MTQFILRPLKGFGCQVVQDRVLYENEPAFFEERSIKFLFRGCVPATGHYVEIAELAHLPDVAVFQLFFEYINQPLDYPPLPLSWPYNSPKPTRRAF